MAFEKLLISSQNLTINIKLPASLTHHKSMLQLQWKSINCRKDSTGIRTKNKRKKGQKKVNEINLNIHNW